MRTFTLDKIFFVIILLTTLNACNNNSRSVDIMKQAQSIVDEQPQQAINLLNTILNPEDMGEEKHMEYVTTLTQAKFRARQSIVNDTLIFAAQRYFERKKKPEKAMLASLYAGNLYHQRNQFSKALEYYLKSEQFARQTNDNILIGKSLNNIGYTYYQQDIMDSSIVYYERALDHYSQEKETGVFILQTLINIGNSYYINKDFDKSNFYYTKGLALSKEYDNKEYEYHFFHKLGITHREIGDYDTASEYLQKALAQAPDKKENLYVYLNLAKLYDKKNQLDSAQYYLGLIKEGIPEIKDNYVLRSIYASLSKYNKQIGNLESALEYETLKDSAEEKIAEENRARELYETNKRFFLEKKDKEMEEARKQFFIYITLLTLVASLLIILVLFLIRSMYRAHRQEMEEADKIKKIFCERAENLKLLQSTYLDIVEGLLNIELQTRKMVDGGKCLQQSNSEAIQMVYDLKTKTDQQLIDWAKDCINKLSLSDDISQILDDNQILLLTLYAYKYSVEEIAIILQKPEEKIIHDKLELKERLIAAGLSAEQIRSRISYINQL